MKKSLIKVKQALNSLLLISFLLKSSGFNNLLICSMGCAKISDICFYSKFMRLLLFACLILFLSFTTTQAQENKNIVSLEAVVVIGKVPGPDLWKVSKNDNVLWILGTLSPLPKKMDWNSKPIEEVIKNSQALLLPPSVKADIGFFKALSLAKTAIGIKKNPNKQLLKEMMPAELYSRWLNLKNQYLKNNNRIEKQRPIFASQKLFESAIKKSGLKYSSEINKKVKRLSRKHKLEILIPEILLDLNKPKAALKKLKKTNINDLDCFSKTLDRIENDLENMKTRAIAWSNGNINQIKALPFPDDIKSCSNAILNSNFAQDIGLDNLQSQWQKKWLDEAKKLLSNNKSTFATLPISQLVNSDGVLSSLIADGYIIEAPK